VNQSQDIYEHRARTQHLQVNVQPICVRNANHLLNNSKGLARFLQNVDSTLPTSQL